MNEFGLTLETLNLLHVLPMPVAVGRETFECWLRPSSNQRIKLLRMAAFLDALKAVVRFEEDEE